MAPAIGPAAEPLHAATDTTPPPTRETTPTNVLLLQQLAAQRVACPSPAHTVPALATALRTQH